MSDITIISVLNFVSGIVAFLISYYAHKNNRLVGSILLRYISTGFLLLGTSLVLQAGTETLVGITALDAVRIRGVELLLYLVYTALQLIAYGVFAWGYGLSLFAGSKPAATSVVPSAVSAMVSKVMAYAVFILAVYVASQIGTTILLFLIVVQGVRVFARSKSNLALIVLFGFSLIFGGHLIVLSAVLSSLPPAFLVGNSIEFCGFVSLLFFLVWSGRDVK